MQNLVAISLLVMLACGGSKFQPGQAAAVEAAEGLEVYTRAVDVLAAVGVSQHLITGFAGDSPA